MRFTLLEMVQETLSDMDSDEVNSIHDTVESLQVASIFRSVYYDMITDLGLPENETLFELDASGDSDQPVLMTLPSNVSKVRMIEYDNMETDDDYKDYKVVTFKPLDEFFKDQNLLREYDADVAQMSFEVNGETFEVMYRTDSHPLFYTTMDDQTYIFDAYDSDIDTTLQKSKTRCVGVVYPTFDVEDDFIPDLEMNKFSYYKNRAKARAFSLLKQVENRDAAGEARRQKVVMQAKGRVSERVPAIEMLPRYGRKTWNSASRLTKQQKGAW